MKKVFAGVLFACLVLVGCSEETPQNAEPESAGQKTNEQKTVVWKDSSKDAYTRADAYAAFVSGGDIRPCPLAPGEVGKTGTEEETFKCINNAAFAGCFEALRGKKFVEQEWRAEYPEQLMFSSAEAAHKKCASFK